MAGGARVGARVLLALLPLLPCHCPWDGRSTRAPCQLAPVVDSLSRGAEGGASQTTKSIEECCGRVLGPIPHIALWSPPFPAPKFGPHTWAINARGGVPRGRGERSSARRWCKEASFWRLGTPHRRTVPGYPGGASRSLAGSRRWWDPTDCLRLQGQVDR